MLLLKVRGRPSEEEHMQGVRALDHQARVQGREVHVHPPGCDQGQEHPGAAREGPRPPREDQRGGDLDGGDLRGLA